SRPARCTEYFAMDHTACVRAAASLIGLAALATLPTSVAATETGVRVVRQNRLMDRVRTFSEITVRGPDREMAGLVNRLATTPTTQGIRRHLLGGGRGQRTYTIRTTPENEGQLLQMIEAHQGVLGKPLLSVRDLREDQGYMYRLHLTVEGPSGAAMTALH